MTSRQLVIAVVGATGAVGRQMLATLEARRLPVARLRAIASPRSAGSEVMFRGEPVVVESLDEAQFHGVDLALFSAGGSMSLEHAPRAVRQGAIVIDNSSAWRMDERVPLVVPEVNPEALEHLPRGIIANPNCSTIQMVTALKPLHDEAGLCRLVVSTYQAASGAGQQGVEELLASIEAHQGRGEAPRPNKFAHPLAFEALPHIDQFTDSGYTREELKMVHETRKIMALPKLDVSATCVRVPVVTCHSEAVTADFERALSASAARALLAAAPGVTVLDEPARALYPLARRAAGSDPVWVGRIRQDLSRPETLHLWIVADNLLKGAALNAVQITEALLAQGALSR